MDRVTAALAHAALASAADAATEAANVEAADAQGESASPAVTLEQQLQHDSAPAALGAVPERQDGGGVLAEGGADDTQQKSSLVMPHVRSLGEG